MASTQAYNNAALGYLALQLANANGASPAEAPGPDYLRHIWVSFNSGDDLISATRGRIDNPYKTMQRALNDKIRDVPNVTKLDAERIFVVHVMDAPLPTPTTPKLELPRSRRMVIHAPGIHLPSLDWELRSTDAFGGQPAMLVLLGDPGDAVSAAEGPTVSAGAFANPGILTIGNNDGVGPDAGLALRLRHSGTTPAVGVVHLANVATQGGIFVNNNAGASMFPVGAPVISGERCALRRIAAFTGIGPSITTTVGPFIDSNVSDNFPIQANLFLGMHGGKCGADIVVTAGGGPLAFGFLGTKITAAASWTGPAGSCLLDYTANFWAVSLGAAIAAIAKTFTENQVP